MTLTNRDLADYFDVSLPTAGTLKKEILKHVKKETSRVTVADLAQFEGINIFDMLQLLGKKQLKKTA